MIFGIGTDIIQISRVERAMTRSTGRFAERVLGVEELDVYRRRAARSPARGLSFLSTRFAAKEAFSKAIGVGMHWPMTWRAMQTLNAPSGAPEVVLGGDLQHWVDTRGLRFRISLSDETDYAVAFVIAEYAGTIGREGTNTTCSI